MNFLTHLECGLCRETLEPNKVWNLCPKCNKPLLARYDLEAAKASINPDIISQREPNMWRYKELLPVSNSTNILTLGEGFTPLHHAQRLGKELGFANLYIKDEGLNPTGSFKARGLCVAISRAKELGDNRCVHSYCRKCRRGHERICCPGRDGSICVYANGCA